MMNWNQLLSFKRLGDARDHSYERARPPWQFDYDRIIFSSAFRRMQDKTQVFPLSGSDYVRTRLTHSLEVSTVAKSLGTAAGQTILERWGHLEYQDTKKPINELLGPSDIGTICATGALAHDIGNPPFGHSGENAIRYWFQNSEVANRIKRSFSKQQMDDFENWEGNAEGFRILGRQQMARDDGGLRLTYAALGAYAKYPTASTAVLDKDAARRHVHGKKPGFFEHDTELWKEVAEGLGLIQEENLRWCRHPLSFLTEASDDICYRIIDLEDGLRLGRVSYEEVEQLYLNVIKEIKPQWRSKFPEWDDNGRINYLRALVFGAAVRELVEAFTTNESSLLEGAFQGDLLSRTPSSDAFDSMKLLAVKNVYSMRGVLEIEAAGFEIIPGLLEAFADAVEKVAAERETYKKCPKSRKLIDLMPREFRENRDGHIHHDPYLRLLGVVDFVAGMTDSFALSLYRRIKGIALPG